MITIYGLIDPFTNQLKYIGSTENLEQRIYTHLKNDKLNNGCAIDCITLEKTELGRYYWENFYIEYFSSIGCDLLNVVNHSCANYNDESIKRKVTTNTNDSPMTKTMRKKAKTLLDNRMVKASVMADLLDMSKPTLKKIRDMDETASMDSIIKVINTL